MSEQAQSFLEKLKEVNKKKSLDIYLPSIGKKIKFLPFTLKQQKSILSKLPTDASGLITFNNVFNEIIRENAEEPLDLCSINVFDRLAIVLSYRSETIGADVEINEKVVNINQVIKQICNYDFKESFQVHTIELDDISAKVQIPSLKYDSQINNDITKKIGKHTNQQEILSELFTSEVLKYIVEITIGDDTISLYDIQYNEKLTIVEQLPGEFVKKIFKFIEGIKSLENELTSVNGVKVELTSELFS